MMAKQFKSDAQPGTSAKERILETAQLLFYREGVRSTGVDRIISEAGVTKVTFYRHFPSKDELVVAFLERRHAMWIGDFRELLAKHRGAQSSHQRRASPLAPVLHAASDIILAPTFRGCAFANTVAEVGPILPAVLGIAARHKQEVRDAIASLLPTDEHLAPIAWAATLALDGAIANAQTGGQSAQTALAGLQTILEALSRSVRK
jgi:AcrR family transcriptional regulator